ARGDATREDVHDRPLDHRPRPYLRAGQPRRRPARGRGQGAGRVARPRYPARAHRGGVEMTGVAGPAARSLQVPDSFREINAAFYERGWTDGLPIVPPTEEAVAEMLRWTDRAPSDVVAVLAPRQGLATVEAIAINAVMAG